MENDGLIYIGLAIAGVLFIIAAARNNSTWVNTTCDWCSGELQMTRDLFRSNRNKGIGNYCCTDCEEQANTKVCKCDWCGGKFDEDRREYLKNKQNGVGNYCCGKCRRDDENTRNNPIKQTRKLK